MAKLSSSNLPNLVNYNSSLENLEAAGSTTLLNISENSVGIGACLGYDSTGDIVLTNTDSTSLVICTYLAIETGTSIKEVLIKGLIRNDVWTLSPGKEVYLRNTTPGLLTTTKPINPDDLVQVIGVAINSNTLLFDPDKTWLRL